MNVSKNPKGRADHEIQGVAVLTQIGHNHPFTLKGDFLKNELILILSTSCTPTQHYNVLKKIIKVDHKTQGWIIFGQNGLIIFF